MQNTSEPGKTLFPNTSQNKTSPPSLSPSGNSTLIDILRWRAKTQPDRSIFTFLSDGRSEEVSFTFAELDRKARAIARRLQSQGAEGQRALLLYPPGLEYIAAFFGCLYAGVIAVPTYPPDPIRLERTFPRFLSILKNAQPAFALTTVPIFSMIQFLFEQYPDLQTMTWIPTDEDASEQGEAEWQVPDVSQETIAFLQYTSGSTSEPKGVMLTHGNLLHNLEAIRQAFQADEDDRGVIWLPFYHDMGLIGGILEPIYCGVQITFLSPLHFLQHPLLWLEAISRKRANISGGPNFAYDLCVRKSTPEQRQALDLSSWELAFNGSEPIRVETLDRFAEAFAPAGFRREAFYPCYGLAEATLLVAGGEKLSPPVFKTVQAAALGQDRIVQASPTDAGARTLVSSGHAWLDQTILVVNPDSMTRLQEGSIGEIWLAGPSIAQGYWNQPEATRLTFQATLDGSQSPQPQGPFLRTGDLGFWQDGQLFITGRLKDLMIVQGLNHYPQDIEQTVEKTHPALRPGSCAAFSIETNGKEQAVVVAEVAPGRAASRSEAGTADLDVEAIKKEIRRAVAEKHEFRLHEIILIKPGTLPKTSSGKVQRYACKAAYLAGTLEIWGIE